MDNNRSQALYTALLEIFFTDTIGSCHVETAVEFLERLPNKDIGPVLKMVRLISGSVSDLLAFSFMENVQEALRFLSYSQLEEWVTEALGIYEARGLQAAKDFFSNPAETTLRYSSKNVAMLMESASDMRLLAAGLSGRDIRFDAAPVPFTDTETVFAPGSCAIFPTIEENHLFYRVSIVHKCAQLRYDSFLIPVEEIMAEFPRLFQKGESISESFGFILFMKRLQGLFPEQDVKGLYCLFDTIRIENVLLGEYRGLSRNFSLLKAKLRTKLDGQGHLSSLGKRGLALRLAHWILNDYDELFFPKDSGIDDKVRLLCASNASAMDSARALYSYLLLKDETDTAFLSQMLPYVGSVEPERLGARLHERRSYLERAFVEILGAVVADQRSLSEVLQQQDLLIDEKRACPFSGEEEGAMAMVVAAKDKEQKDVSGLLENLVLEASQEVKEQLSNIIREIRNDLGQVPSSYVSSALDLATGAYDSRIEMAQEQEEKPVFSFYTYPEWDFRRGAYRKNWCTVKEMLGPTAKGDFVSRVLARYKGQVMSLRRQFELMRQDYRFIRRQRDGEEIDIDAFVEAYADIQASVSPSENLYTRLIKDQRDIAVLFLIDMSASTEGWINQAIKESLVLLTTAMEQLGDRYAIYGFSGMQRTGCQTFIIKEFDHEYDKAVEERITGINARDYTRMGPAIRHAITKLEQVEARLKILLTLSDGKPEDYDEYKGPYAIEDTRMSLFEAYQKGVRPFCITVDKEARDYLPRMYGAANYILVPDVRLLHKRVPEIYRILTT